MPVSVSEKSIKSKIKAGDSTAVIENIKYPYFDSQNNKKLCQRMNEFYTSVAEKYSFYAKNKLPKRINLKRLSCSLPMTVSMSYTVSVCNGKIISVILDLMFTEGKNVKMRRFSQMWSIAGKNILPLNQILRTDIKSKKKIYSLVVEAAEKNGENPAFGYFEDYLTRLSRNFDVRNCYAVPKGMCFFVNAGILSPKKYGVNSFVIPFHALEQEIIGNFLPDEDEKREQNADIVNNV